MSSIFDGPVRLIAFVMFLWTGNLAVAAPWTVPDASLAGTADLIVVGTVIEATPRRATLDGDAGYAMVRVERALKGAAGETVRVNYFAPGFEIPPYSVSDNAVFPEKDRRGLFFLQRARGGYAFCYQQDGLRPVEEAEHFADVLADYPVEITLAAPPELLRVNGMNRFTLTIRNRGEQPLHPRVTLEGYFHSTCLPARLPRTYALDDNVVIAPGGDVILTKDLYTSSPEGWDFIAGQNREMPVVILQTPITARLRVRLTTAKDDPGFDAATPCFSVLFGQQAPEPAEVETAGLSVVAFKPAISLTELYGRADFVAAGTVTEVKEDRGITTVTLAIEKTYKGAAENTVSFTCRNNSGGRSSRVEIPLLEPEKGQQGIFFLQGAARSGYYAFAEAKSLRPMTESGDVEKLAAAFPIELALEAPLPVLYFHRSTAVRLHVTNRAAYPIEYGQFMHEINARYVVSLLTVPRVNQVLPMGFNQLPPVILQPGETRVVTATYTCERPPEWRLIAPGSCLLTPLALRVTADFTPKTEKAEAFAVSTSLQVVMTGFPEDAAISELAHGEQAPVAMLLQALAGRDPLLLNEVIPTIGPWCGEEIIPALIALLRDCPVRVERRGIVDTLVRIGPKAGLALSALLEIPDAKVQEEAVRGVGLLAYAPAIPVLLRLLDTPPERWPLHQSVVEALTAMGEPAVEPLAAAIERGDEAARKAAEALGNIGLPALPALLLAAQSPDAAVRHRALIGLARVKNAQAEEALFAALNDPHYMVRSAAAFYLQETGNRRVIPVMLEALTGTDEAMIRRAAWVLAHFAEPRGIPVTIAAFHGQAANARWEMAQALKGYGEAALPALAEALKNPEADVRNTAAWAFAFQRDARALPVLLEGLAADDKTLQFSAMALKELQDSRAIDPLIAALENASLVGKARIAEALSTLTKQHFGDDLAQWQAWRLANPAP